MIYRADEADMERVWELTHRFNEKYYPVPLSRRKWEAWFMHHLNQGVIFLSDNGFISGLLIEDPCRDWWVLAETAWYDEGNEGGALLEELRDYAIDVFADELRLTTLNTTPDGVDRYLRRKGFEVAEISHSLFI